MWFVEDASTKAISKDYLGAFTRRATLIQQPSGPLEDVQTTSEYLNDCRKMLSEMDALIQQPIENADYIDAEDADVFVAAKTAVKWSQGKIEWLQPPSQSGAAAPSSCRLTTKLPNFTILSFSGEYSLWVSFCDKFTKLVGSKVDMTSVEKL